MIIKKYIQTVSFNHAVHGSPNMCIGYENAEILVITEKEDDKFGSVYVANKSEKPTSFTRVTTSMELIEANSTIFVRQ